MNPKSTQQPPIVVAALGYGGLLPFIGLTCLIGLDPAHSALWHRALWAYSAVILSFVGALHWGFAMLGLTVGAQQRSSWYVWSVIPALLAWVALLLPSLFASVLLGVGFVAHYIRDIGVVRSTNLPEWYLPLRRRLSLIAVISIVAGGWVLP